MHDLLERAGRRLLGALHERQFRRDWQSNREPPHFFDQRYTFSKLYEGELGQSVMCLARGMFANEIIRPGDVVLDIGRGDGTVTKRFSLQRRRTSTRLISSRAQSAKARSALSADGVVCGSESLGNEGHDHLQFFQELENRKALASPHFRHVRATHRVYGIRGGLRRVEGFFRASQQPDRLEVASWR